MEGVTDAPMRALLSERGGFNYCVSEFLRISQDVLPPKVYLEHIPELRADCRTPSGTPIQVQLLGGNEELLALSAVRACELGARAIDLNFGCPAPTVNRHDGGAALLRYPDRIRSIVAAVRAAVPAEFPVSAKLRLGWDDMNAIHLNAERAAEGGASWITIHARTKVQGYIPPAHWKYIGAVRKNLDIPVVANGEIWTREDFLKCRDETGCEHYMIGRGALADPELSWVISHELGLKLPSRCQSLEGSFSTRAREWLPLIERFAEHCAAHVETHSGAPYTVRRVKQWVKMASLKKELPWFELLKRTQTLSEVYAVLSQLD